MKKDTIINLRISQEIKDRFQEIADQEGFTMSQILEASMKDIVSRNYIPIYIKSKIERKREPIITIPFIKSCLETTIEKTTDKVKSVSLFGSYSTGTATPSSDVDLFIETDDDFSLFDLADLKTNLEKALGKKVDLATRTDDEYFINHIRREKITLYERR